uniref:Glass n=1 Tax=Rhipicephalus appendiculatus TaxID=34631 RepID=A0A131YN27_RHIAP
MSQEQYGSLVNVHGRLHHCRQCTYVTKERTNMKMHIRKHTGERPSLCQLCPAAFIHNSHLKRHMLTHTGERPFSCVYCNASFTQKSNLNYHISHRHSKKKP